MDESKIVDAMIVEGSGKAEESAIDASVLADGLAGEQGKPGEEPAEQKQEAPADAQGKPEKVDSRKAIERGIRELSDDGWTEDDFNALIKDDKVRADIQAGKDFMRVVAAFERRRNAAKPEEGEPAAKKSVPTVRNASTAGMRNSNRIAEMTDKEFDEFSKRARAAVMSGKMVTIR